MSSVSFNVEAERAKVIKENAKLLVIFHLKTPFAYDYGNEEFSYLAGNTTIIRKLIVGEINDLWLVNTATGEIYFKLVK